MQRTELARGTINQSDELLIELRQPDNMPATVVIVWPPAPSVASPAAFPPPLARSRLSWRAPRYGSRNTKRAVGMHPETEPLVP
jgi:hypothetical protein